MTNLRIKGWKTEKRCENELIKEGWKCIRVQNSGNMYQKRKDFFGLWDVIALKGHRIKFVQCKTNNLPSLIEYKAFAQEHKADNFDFELWIWYNYKTGSYVGGNRTAFKGWRKIDLITHVIRAGQN